MSDLRGQYQLIVALNGTDENPWRRMGLTQNPFPQIGHGEFDAGERRLNALDGEPIRDEADLRRRLAGFSDEFIELCVKQFTPGKRVRFMVTFPA